MDANKILADLECERERIDEVILAIRRIAAGGGRRRGRPPSWLKSLPARRGRPVGSKNKPKPMQAAPSAKPKQTAVA